MISNIRVHVLSGCAVISTTMFTSKTFRYVCASIYMSLYGCTQIYTEYVIKHLLRVTCCFLHVPLPCREARTNIPWVSFPM